MKLFNIWAIREPSLNFPDLWPLNHRLEEEATINIDGWPRPKQKLWTESPCMSEHMIYIKNVTNVTQTLHQNVTNVTKQNIASKEILTIEFHTKYMKLFVNMLSVICVLLNTKFHNTSENFYFEVILSRTIVSCKVTNVTNRYMDFILDLDKEFNFQRPVCLDSNRMHYYQSKIC